MNEPKIQRWTSADGDDGAEMWRDADGEYVLYADHIAALSQRPAAPAWIKVEERLPVTGSLCWIVWAGTVQTTAYRRFGLGFACADGYAWEDEYGQGDSIPDAEVTHWQPLPAPPLASPVPKEQK